MKEKKSQITLYIIIGLLAIVFIGLLVHVLRLEAVPEVPPEMPEIAADVLPIRNFVQECISQTAKQGLDLLGKNGGYIRPENLMIETSPMAYKSDALLYSPDTLPYWNFIDQYNRLRSLKPGLYKQFAGDNSIEDQLANYIEANLRDCTGDFGVFSDTFTIYSGAVSADARARGEDVAVSVIYPLKIVANGNQTTTVIKDFTANVDVHLKQIYDFASSITSAEQKYHFLESMTMNMITVYSGISENALPPTSSLKLGRDKVVWARSEVEDILRYDLLDFVRLIQVKNALNYNPLIISPGETEYQLKQGLYNTFNYQLEDGREYNLTSDFFYPQSPIYLSIGDQEIIMPQDRIPSNIVTDMLNLQIQDYAFEYDIAYPVIVKIRDPKALGYQGYEFQFSLEANIRDNAPVNASMLSQKIPSTKIDINKPGQLVTEPLTVTAYEKRENIGTPLEGVQVYYKCGQKAYMGETGSDGKLTRDFPYCLAGGKIIYTKPGYLGSAVNYNNNGQQPGTFSLYIYPKAKFDIAIRKRTQANINALANAGPLSPVERRALELEQAAAVAPEEKVVMVIERIKQSSDEDSVPVPNFLIFNPNVEGKAALQQLRQQVEEQYSTGQISLEQKANALQAITEQEKAQRETMEEKYELELVPGNYSVEAYLINYKGTSIPEKVEAVGVWPFEKDVTYPAQTFSIWQNGGASFNATLYESEIYRGSSTITFYVFDLGIPTTWDELANYKQLSDYQQYNYLLKPVVQG